jgi:hypothetical protein
MRIPVTYNVSITLAESSQVYNALTYNVGIYKYIENTYNVSILFLIKKEKNKKKDEPAETFEGIFLGDFS